VIHPLYNFRARTLYVVDGDTIDLEFDVGFGVSFRDRVRLARIDAWEKRGSEREQGLAAEGFVRSLLHKDYTNAYPLLVSTAKDKGKYGRWIAEIWLPDGRNLSDALVEEGHAEYWEY
jgi:micrococcal nuclease